MLAVAGPHEVGSVMNGVAAPPGGLPSSVRFIDSIHMSCCPSSGIPTFCGRFVITESSPPSELRSATGETMNTLSAPSGGRTTTPSRAGSPAPGWRL